MLAGDAGTLALMGADGDIQAVILLLQLLKGDLFAHRHIGMGLNAQRQDGVDLRIEHFPGEAVAGNAVAQHTAQLLTFLVDGDLVAHQCQIVSAAQSAGAAANDRHTLSCGRCAFRLRHIAGMIHRIALQPTNIQRRIDHISAAACLAGVLADIGAGRGHGIVLADQAHGIGAAALTNQCHITGYIHTCRTHGYAGHRQRQTGKTAMMLNMFDVILAKALQAVHHQSGSVTANGTVSRIDNAAGCLFNNVQCAHVGLAVQHLSNQFGQLAQTNTAGHAFAAGLRMAQLQKGQRHIYRAQTGR